MISSVSQSTSSKYCSIILYSVSRSDNGLFNLFISFSNIEVLLLLQCDFGLAAVDIPSNSTNSNGCWCPHKV